jgi:prepilin-type N-terminal cleavage/methylation domain-containing protein
MVNKNSTVLLKGFTQLEKLIDNMLITKVVIITKKLLYLKQNKSSVFQTGFTLIEALIVIAIIGLMSVFYVVNLRPDTTELLKMDTTRLAADIRYVRSLATSRVTYNNGIFPVGGYGIVFYNRDGSSKSFYQLYAGNYGNPANIIKTVELSDSAFHLLDPNSSTYSSDINVTATRSFYFESENSIGTNGFQMSADGDYQIEIYYSYVEPDASGVNKNYYSKAKINIGRQTADYFVWSNLAIAYDSRGIQCGNGIVETGETCEQLDIEGAIQDAECFPAGHPKQCQRNSCGDGVIAGTEACELNDDAAVNYYANRCSNVPHVDWCYRCDNALNNGAVCQDMDGTLIPCCLSHASAGTCTDCQWDAANCWKEPDICPIDD